LILRGFYFSIKAKKEISGSITVRPSPLNYKARYRSGFCNSKYYVSCSCL